MRVKGAAQDLSRHGACEMEGEIRCKADGTRKHAVDRIKAKGGGGPLCQLKAKGGQFEDARKGMGEGGVACMLFFAKSVIHGHRTLKAPHPV